MVPGYKTFHFMGPEDLHRQVFEAKGKTSLDEWALSAFRLKLVHDAGAVVHPPVVVEPAAEAPRSPPCANGTGGTNSAMKRED